MSTIFAILLCFCVLTLFAIYDNYKKLKQLNRNAKYLYKELAYFRGYKQGVMDATENAKPNIDPVWGNSSLFVERDITDGDYRTTI